MSRVVAVVLAGGVGTRFGGERPKQLLDLAGRSVLERSIDAFDAHPGVDEVLVVMASGHLDEARKVASGSMRVRGVVEGGATRSDSTRRALEALADLADDDRVLLHDAARPLVSVRIIDDCLEALQEHGAVGTALASSDTVFEVGDDATIVGIPPRVRLRRAQTPQGFRAGVLRAAYAAAADDPDFEATDDCGVVLRYAPDVPIAVVEGEERNLKVTTPLDLAIAEALLRSASP